MAKSVLNLKIACISAGVSAVSAAVMLLPGCGGGGSSAVKSTPTYSKSYASGRVAGFGSIVIHGVHYDETNATVLDEDGVTHPSSDLKLGMIAEVQASDYGTVDNSANGASNRTVATAQTIIFKSAVQGPVTSIDSVGGTVTILGQLVKIASNTVFDSALAGGLSAIKVNDIVKVYGLPMVAGGGFTATRIEPLVGASAFALSGSVTAYDSVAKTLNIGSTLIDVSGVSLPTTIGVGSPVRLRLQTTQISGAWVAINEQSGADQPQENDHSEVEGTITAYTSATSFSVDGVPVDATGVTLASGTSLAVGTRVQAAGAVVNGVLVATTLSVETDQDVQAEGFDIDGSITALDTTASTFAVRGVTVSFAGSVSVSGGALTDLKAGSSVEVHGALAADGTTLNATAIRIVP